jgi:hypothetical protein
LKRIPKTGKNDLTWENQILIIEHQTPTLS